MNGKQLKNSILQWAIQGKLVPQDPTEEPASVLLERIRAEKARLVKEGKIKKDKNESIIFKGDDNSYYEKFQDGKVVCIDEEIPFEIPDGWEWCRLGTSVLLNPRNSAADDLDAGFIPMAYIGSDLSNTFRFDVRKWKTIKSGFTHLADGDVAFAKITPCITNLKSAVMRGLPNGIAAGTTELNVFRCYGNTIVAEYILYYLATPYVLTDAVYKGTAGQQRIMTQYVSSRLLPIPPFNEQKRIVSKINELLPVIQKYNQVQNSSNILNDNIHSALKKSILQEAIQGRLVSQKPKDEPASELLERIIAKKQQLVKEGKLKAKDAVTSTIFKGDDNKYYEKTGKTVVGITDEIPFDIPDSWCWCRLGTLFQHNTGKALNRADQKGKLLTYITTSNLYWDRFELDNLRQMCFTDEEIGKCTVQKGDLLVCEGGDIGRAAIWPFEESVRIQNHIHRLRPYSTIVTRFFYYTIAHFKDSGVIGGKGIGIQGLSSGALHQLLLPVPPMAEQYKIVEKLDKTLASIMSR